MDPRSVAPNARAAVFAAVCTLLAVAAHRLMSGTGIPAAAELLGALAVFCFARIAAALGERGLASIGLLVGGSQVGLHLLFDAVQAAAAPSFGGSMPVGGATSVGGPMSIGGSMSIGGTAPMPVMDDMSRTSMFGMSSGMTIAHILAAAAAAWWLRRGEAALFAAVERARVVLGASWRLVAGWVSGTWPMPSTRAVLPTVAFGVRRATTARVLQFTVIRRGPPQPASAR